MYTASVYLKGNHDNAAMNALRSGWNADGKDMYVILHNGEAVQVQIEGSYPYGETAEESAAAHAAALNADPEPEDETADMQAALEILGVTAGEAT